MGMLDISHTKHIKTLAETDISSRWEWSKKSVQQGRSPLDARSVLIVREHGKRARTPLAAFFKIPIYNEPFVDNTPEIRSSRLTA